MNRILRTLFVLAVPFAFGSTSTHGEVGLELLGELNCSACHAATAKQSAWLSPKSAPRLAEVGSRASAGWIQNHLLSPQGTLPGTAMPDVLHNLSEKDRAAAAEELTHYLVSLQPARFHSVLPDRAAVARGENLYHRIGCVACHAPQNTTTNAIASAPLPRLAAKWSFDGLQRFLSDPLATRPSGRMPGMNLTEVEAADIAHYLLRDTQVPAALEVAEYRTRLHSLEEMDSVEPIRTGPAESFTVSAMGNQRRYALRFTGWLRIEQAGEYTFHLTAEGASRLAIHGDWRIGDDSWQRERVDAKAAYRLNAGWHPIMVDYVQRGPNEPALKVEWEGPGVARETIPRSRLQSSRDTVTAPPEFLVDSAKAAKGRELYAELNCAACHEGKPPANPPPALAALETMRGCLAEKPGAKAPDYHLDATQREALRLALAALNRADLGAPSPQERVANTLASFKCYACHTRNNVGGVKADRDSYFTSNGEDLGDEGRLPPRLDGVGDKLKPAWLGSVLARGASVRPYMNTRMPQFGAANVGHLAELFIALDRHPQPLQPVADAPDIQREAGRKLVGTDGGLSCIACHRFNRQPAQALQVIDLATVTERLNEDWFRKFVIAPNRFHPGTRMPSFWPNGVSLLPTLLDGSTERQHAAIWTYLADGVRAKFPEGLSRKNVELVVGGEAVVYRGKLWEAGFRAVAVGYPGQLNTAFDAEEMRLALLWRGRFLNAGAHWGSQGMGQIHPLGTDVVVLPHGSPLAVLADVKSPWPVEASKDSGMKFGGYQLDAMKRPTLLYSFRNLSLEDFLMPIEATDKSGLRRTIKFSAAPPEGLHLRLAVGRLTPRGENSWRLDDALTLTVKGSGRPFVRGKDDQQELLVPIRAGGGAHPVEVEYVW